MNIKLIKALGALATIGGIITTLLSNWVNEREMEAIIDDKVNKALADKENEDEEAEEEEP